MCKSCESWRKLLDGDDEDVRHLEDEQRADCGAFGIVEHDEMNPFCSCPDCLRGYVEHGILQESEGENSVTDQEQAPDSGAEKHGTCEKCSRPNRVLSNVGSQEFPVWRCGTCIHREARRINTREMYGRGRRGY